jgi:DNA-binding NtrC family response regulator
MFAPTQLPGAIRSVSRTSPYPAEPVPPGRPHVAEVRYAPAAKRVIPRAEVPRRTSGPRILLVDNDERLRRTLARLLEGEGYEVVALEDSGSISDAIVQERPDIVVVNADQEDPSRVLACLREQNGAGRLIAVAGSPQHAAYRGGFDVLPRPLRADDLLQAVERAVLEQSRLCARIIGATPLMQRLFASITSVAPLHTSVLITGETGTGKELVARALHDLSPRAGKPFVPVHCAALPESLLESELFGHVRGSFTGALASRQGLLEEANSGTLFLDEISTLSSAVQVKLLRVLQEHTIQRVGSNQPVPLDIRVIAATNVDLADEVRAGRFREDLFYRIHVFPVSVPPLRERRADIPLLVEHFRWRFAETNAVRPPDVTPETLFRMMQHDWPGNVRELENAVERMLVADLGAPTARFEFPGIDTHSAVRLASRGHEQGWDLARLEREYILAILEEEGGRRGLAAQRLGIDRRTLDRKLHTYRSEVGTCRDDGFVALSRAAV